MIYLFFALLGFLNPPFFGGGPWFFDDLNLPPDLMAEVKNLHFQHREKVIDLQAELQKEYLKFQELLENDNVTEKELSLAIEKISDLKKNLMKERTIFLFNLKKILPAEEWQKLKDQFMERRQKGKYEKMHRGFNDEQIRRQR